MAIRKTGLSFPGALRALLVLGLAAVVAHPARASSFPYRECHIKTVPAQRIYATLLQTCQGDADFKINRLSAFVAVPPLLPGQADTAATLTIAGRRAASSRVVEHSQLHRTLVKMSWSEQLNPCNQAPMEAHYWATLRSRVIAQSLGPSAATVERERAACSVESPPKVLETV